MMMNSSGNKKVLVVAQDQQTRQWLTQWLQEHGYNPVAARDSESIQGQIVDGTSLVISDIDNPLEDVNRLTAMVKSASANVPVIVVAGAASADTAVQSMRNGATDFLMKPINSSELSAKLNRALNELKLQEELAALQGKQAPGVLGGEVGEESGEVKSLQTLEREAIIDALDRFDGARSKTANALGISVRTLQRKIKEYGYTNGGGNQPSYSAISQQSTLNN